jgi:enamine deaminase RidA (YjgF/YER057c/UK114 family)
MEYKNQIWNDLNVSVRYACFRATGTTEYHAVIELDEEAGNTEMQYGLLEKAVQRLTKLPELHGAVLVWKRFFAGDTANQKKYLQASGGEAVSIVQQPPLNRSKAALWLYFVEDAQTVKQSDSHVALQRDGYEHLFHTQLHERSDNAAGQTRHILEQYAEFLAEKNCSIEKNCIRTWLFVQDVDVQYAGMVTARKDFFNRQELTEKTHYIASTGIEGRYIYPETLVSMDAYAIVGIQQSQIRYLRALSHLSPTYVYGVTFERGTAVDYGDRRHIYISGTASIDRNGDIIYPADVEKQTDRVFENIQALLSEAAATMQNVCHLIVYLRDPADYAPVRRYIDSRYPDIPRVMVWAPVCRQGWLVEIECMAICPINTSYPVF